jgi:RNA polymerase sigma-70 factor (ECF subfamily)
MMTGRKISPVCIESQWAIDKDDRAMDNTTQVTLLDRLREGDGVMAWEEFFGRYWHLVFVTARNRGCQAHTAEEIVQEVMLTVFQQRHVFQYDPSKGRFRDWLRQVVRNAVAKHRREPAQRVRARGGESEVSTPEPIGDDGLDDRWEAHFEQSLLTALLDAVRVEVAPETYQAFELLTLQGLSGAEVARITGLTRNAVYLARKRVLKRLRQLGAAYRDEGQLEDRVREALRSYPDASVERSLTNRVGQTMRER